MNIDQTKKPDSLRLKISRMKTWENEQHERGTDLLKNNKGKQNETKYEMKSLGKNPINYNKDWNTCMHTYFVKI